MVRMRNDMMKDKKHARLATIVADKNQQLTQIDVALFPDEAQAIDFMIGLASKFIKGGMDRIDLEGLKKEKVRQLKGQSVDKATDVGAIKSAFKRPMANMARGSTLAKPKRQCVRFEADDTTEATVGGSSSSMAPPAFDMVADAISFLSACPREV